MNRRTHESPMDFEWQKFGPADPTSPFHQLAVNYQNKQNEKQGEKQGEKRSYSIFESPNKPRAPEPSAQPFLFRPPSPAKAFPAPRKPSFTTPRKPEADLCSSGAEQSSPENADGEDTPDGPSNMQLMRITKDDDADMTDVLDTKRPAKKGLLDDFYSRFNSPGRGELRRGRFSDAITRRVRKRRRPDVDRDTRLAPLWASYDSESDRPHAPAQEDKRRSEDDPPKHASASPALIPSIFAWLESHPNLPHVLSYYAQFFLNVFLVFFFIYIIYSFWATIRSDVDKRSEVVASEVLAEMAACARQFVENRCERDTRVPAMETVCENWERCMNKDPRSVGRAKVSAHTFAEIFNSFVEPISYKAMIFSLILVFGCITLSNFAFGFFRAKASPPAAVPVMIHPHHQYPHPQASFYGPSSSSSFHHAATGPQPPSLLMHHQHGSLERNL